MDAKTLILFLVLALAATPCMAGPASISGTMSCYMPDHVEMEAAREIPQHSGVQPPSASGAGGAYEVSREERTVNAEEMTADESRITRTDNQGQEQTVTIYTVCAK
ncbi:MAG: hypothetical protein PHH75_01995 [Candidatus Omnitrophica bacterium]|nr:hypothetical protein [Candidatus Omnitrophota bacterium]MDD5573932.1 hypothetical protein [Candidatus Omnitrophota bacterium]